MSPVPSVHAVILAGGSGTRFWPASRRHTPKQLLPLGGSADVPLIAATLQRLRPLIPDERVWVSTGAALVTATAATLPTVPATHMLAEPVARNTAPAIGWATATIARQDPDALVAVLPADHAIADEEAFRGVVTRALRAAEGGWLATIGVVPTRPDTGYGYIEVGELLAAAGEGVHAAARFVEKPNRTTAGGYLAGGRHLWNAGMFFFRAKAMLAAIEKHLPALARGLDAIDAAARAGNEAAVLAQVFPTLPSISIDHGVMEKAERIAVVPGDFGWNDVGSWEATWEMSARDDSGNSLPEGSIAVDAKNNLVRDMSLTAQKKRWALVGVSDLVVVETDDAVLVISREKAQDVRAVVEALTKRGEIERL
jgi:mannose-1-phosphate guanylyltransferase